MRNHALYLDAHKQKDFFYAAALTGGYRYGFEKGKRYPHGFNVSLLSALTIGAEVVCFSGVGELVGITNYTDMGPRPEMPEKLPSVEHISYYVKTRNIDLLVQMYRGGSVASGEPTPPNYDWMTAA